MTSNISKLNDKWHFSEKRPTDPDDKTLAIDNFLLEERDGTDILVREIVQNVLDVRKEDSEGKK